MQNRTYFSQVRKEIIPLLPSQVNRVLEIGCGSGTTLKWLKENNFVFKFTNGFSIPPPESLYSKRPIIHSLL